MTRTAPAPRAAGRAGVTGRLERTATYGILGLFAMLSLTPVLGILSTAFGSRDALDTGFALPDGLHWDNFAEAWTRGHFGGYLANSVLVTVAVVAATTVLALTEAARVDGANSWSTLWRILAPMGRPAISTMVVIVFMWTWNEFLLALVMVSDEAHRTVPLGLAFFQGQHSSDTALLAAASVLIALPVVVVYLALQRRFLEGMLTGSLKE